MLGFLKSLISEAPPAAAKPERAPEWVTVKGGFEFALAQHLARHEGYPIADWEKVRAWVDGLEPEARRAQAWTACERAWLLHFRDALGNGFRLDESDTAALGALDKLHEKMRRFWSVVSIQDFWSGQSFHRPGDSNELSYELARIIVEQLAADWAPFARFVRGARAEDAGAAAARECLGLDLGEAVTALLERDTPKSWSPDPARWEK